MTGPGSPPLAWTELERLVAAGDVDTVIVAFTDMQGRLAGKRISGRHFVDDIATAASSAAVICWPWTST